MAEFRTSVGSMQRISLVEGLVSLVEDRYISLLLGAKPSYTTLGQPSVNVTNSIIKSNEETLEIH
jgi:hypothetical protein